ncbi:MAG: PQQ-binding-like beta-propeller repeat protein [Rhodopirellula sp.]|nr:PQQ-binding-like beta-propeller repeat protein [Rhodopirellula sp.]
MSESFPDKTAVDRLFESTDDVIRQSAPPPREYRFRWGWGLGILALGIVAELIVWNLIGQDRTYQVIYSLSIVSGTPFFLLIWWMFFSGVDWATRFLGAGAVAAVGLLFYSQYRFDGFEGDMIPRFTSRFEPTAESRLAKFQKTQSSSETIAAEWTVDAEQDWDQYRGPARDGVVRNVPTNVDWTVTPEKVWRHPVGAGWSSFSIARLTLPQQQADATPISKAYLFTQEQRGELECVVAYDTQSGDQIWVHEDSIRFEETLGGPGPRATPTVHGPLLFSLGATGQLNCLKTLTGEKVWATNILEDADATNLDWAMAGSPLVVGDKVIVNPGGGKGSGVIAYDTLSGDKVWAVGNDPAGYTAPVLATLLGKPQVIIYGGLGPVGHDLDTGQELWRFKWENGPKVNAAIPTIVDDSSIMISCGYALGSALLRFSHEGDNWNVTSDWESKRLKLKFNAPVRKGDYVYGLDEGVLTCIDLRTGKPEWKRGRYGYGQILRCGDVLIVQAENSEVVFVSLTPEKHEELHRFQALDGKSWNHPVVWNGHLFLRNGEEAACFNLQTE